MNTADSASSRRWFLALAAALVVLKLWLVAAQPVVAIGGAGHDDQLYLALARHLLNGEWLGPYSQFTLMKGPVYSLFIAGSFLLGVPLPLAQHLLYLAGCVALVQALRPHLRPAAACALFAVLWWNPMSYELPVLGRVLRQNVYTPLTLLSFAGAIALATRQSAPARVRAAWGILLGASAAGLWMTREETIWIVPSALVLLGAAAWASWRAGDRLRSLVAPVVAAVAVGGAALLAVCALNLHAYGWFGTVEFRAPEFLAAYGSLQRIDSSPIPYVPVTREAREKAYAVSPAFAELRPYLDGDIGRGWAVPSAALTGHPPADREIAGGWFMWALRDAVIAAGHGRSARDALDFYGRVAAEVNRACDRGRLAAGPRHDTMVPRWRPEMLRRLTRTLPGYTLSFVTFRGFSARPAVSMGNAWVLQLFRDLTRWRLAPSTEAPELDLPLQQRFDGMRIEILQWTGKGVRWIGAGIFLAGLACWLRAGISAVRTRRAGYLFAVATASLIGAAAVLAVNLLVDVMAFPNSGPGALAQGYPLLLLFGCAAIIEAFQRRTTG